MSVLLVGDAHLANHKYEGGELIDGINRRCRELIEALRRTVDQALELVPDLTAVVQVGDLFDTCRPDPAVVSAFLELATSYNLDWHLLAGNHDLRAFGAPSALAPLRFVPRIRIYERPESVWISGMRFAMVPYVSHSATEALKLSVPALRGAEVVVLHYGVVDTATRPDQIAKAFVGGYLANLAAKDPWIISGHEHGERTTESWRLRADHSNCVGLGSMADLDWSAARFSWPCATVVDTGGALHPIAVDGPHFTRLGWDDGDPAWERMLLSMAVSSFGYGLYVEVPPSRAAYAEVLRSIGILQGWRIQPSQAPEESVPVAGMERQGFGDLEAPIAEVLDAGGHDLAEEKTQRVWSRCLDHMKEK